MLSTDRVIKRGLYGTRSFAQNVVLFSKLIKPENYFLQFSKTIFQSSVFPTGFPETMEGGENTLRKCSVQTESVFELLW